MLDPADAPPALFLEQTAVTEVDGQPGTYAGFLSDQWNCPLVPHGGVVTAVALRAMAAALDVPEQRLRSVTSVFVAQVRPGDLRIDVEVLRRGRSMSQVSAQIRNADADEGHRLLAVFGAERRGFEFTELQMPSVPPPEQCRGWRDFPPDIAAGPTFNFWQHAESRIAVGHFPWEDYEPTTSDRVYWYRFDEPPFVNGVIDPLAVVALCDTMPGAVGELVGSGRDVWLPPSVDLTVHHFADTSSEWIIATNRADHAGDGYATLEIELWDPDGTLLACATQVCFFTFLEDSPT
jgi:acyl-CoA thioesterase